MTSCAAWTTSRYSDGSSTQDRPAGSPARLRATYNRYNGVMQMIAALDLATGRLRKGVYLPDDHVNPQA